MAVGWYESLKDIPWGKALGAAPAIAERGKQLWERITSAQAPSEQSATPVASATVASQGEQLAALEVRCRVLETRAKAAEEELKASFEVVHALAQQHSELVPAVDALIARTRVLLRICALFGAALIALALFLLLRG